MSNEADLSSGKIKKEAVESWPCYYGELYLMPNELIYVSTMDNFLSIRNFSLEQWGSSNEIQKLVLLDNIEHETDITNLIELLQQKDKAATEVKNIITGTQKIAARETFLPMQLKVKGSKTSCIVLGIFSGCCLIVTIAAGRLWLQNTNPADEYLFIAITVGFLTIAALTALFAYRLFNKIKQVNNDENIYGIWITRKYLICNDPEGLKFIPLPFLNNFKIYRSGRPPLQMLIAEAKPPFIRVQMVCNFLSTYQTPEALEKTVTQKITELVVPEKYITATDAAITYADGHEDSKKMFLLHVKLKDMIEAQPATRATLQKIARYVDIKITHWNDDCRIIPEAWVFTKEVNENWEYGVNGVSSSEKWDEPAYPGHWLVPVSRIFILETKELKPFLGTPVSNNKMADVLAQCPLKKIIIKFPLREDSKRWIKEAFAGHDELKQTEIIFAD
jgi:hypothetical protein